MPRIKTGFPILEPPPVPTCQDCIQYRQFYTLSEQGQYLPHCKGFCKLHDMTIDPLEHGCKSFHEPVIFTPYDRRELERLQEKLKNADKILA